MLTNTDGRSFDVIEITNEMPHNRRGGVGSVIDALMTGLGVSGLRVLWFLMDHGYTLAQIHAILERYPSVAIGNAGDLRTFQAPLVHLHSYQENADIQMSLADRKVVCTIHSLLALEERTNEVSLGDAVAWQEALIRFSTRVVLISDAERGKYLDLGYHRLNPHTSVIHHGIAAPRAYRAPRGKRVLGFCGRLVPRKHPEYVQMILNEDGFQDRRTLIAGRGFSPYARDLLRDRDLESRVDFLGWCAGPRLEAFFDAIDVLAVPSTYEPFGLVALEAACRGVPVVCTRVDGLIEVLGDHAFYCRDTTYEAFRESMLAWNGASRHEIATRSAGARRRYETRFTDRIMAQAYCRLFADLTS